MFGKLIAISFTCLTIPVLAVGCEGEGGQDLPVVSDTGSEMTIVRYTSADLAALRTGEVIEVDITTPGVVYVVEYQNASDLGRVTVISDEERYVLGDKTAAQSAPGFVVLGADMDAVKDVTESMKSGSSEGHAWSSAEGQLGEVGQPAKRLFCCVCDPEAGECVCWEC
jgi:hypothetical protein